MAAQMVAMWVCFAGFGAVWEGRRYVWKGLVTWRGARMATAEDYVGEKRCVNRK